MRRLVFFGALAMAACVAFVGKQVSNRFSTETFSVPDVRPPEAAPLCPWREPETDLKTFFPEANRYEVETRILSGLRLDLAARLGRPPTGDENALRLYKVYKDQASLGAVLTRRVKGENGAIELVLTTDTNQSVRGMRFQRLREPEAIAAALQNTNWQAAFVGKRSQDAWQLGSDVPAVPSAAQASAEAVVQGARSLLILLAAAESVQAPNVADSHHQ